MFHLIPSPKISGNYLNEGIDDGQSLAFCGSLFH